MPVYKHVNKNFFKNWSPQMAYVLGFFAADGYITVNKRGGQFWCIDITDKNLVISIRNVIESEHKISLRKGSGNNKNKYRLQIGSIEMCDDLRKLGYNERKTKSLSVPNIPNKYFNHFSRGYFDGDGHVWIGYINKNRKKKTFVMITGFTSCSKNFLEKFHQNLHKMLGINGFIIKGSGNYYRLNYSIKSSLKLYNFMYNDLGTSRLFLKRKKGVFERFIRMRS